MMGITLRHTLKQLEDLFESANNTFFEGKLQHPVIAINREGNTQSYGWFTQWKAWKKEDSDGYYEINICAESLNRPLEDIICTLLHEMTHLWCHQNEIKDTSRDSSYHNKKFKEQAEQRGLTIEKSDKYGWTLTSLNDSGKCFSASFTGLKFDIHREEPVVMTAKSKGSSSSRKYVCPCCGQSIRATKEVSVLCGECTSPENLVFMEEDM